MLNTGNAYLRLIAPPQPRAASTPGGMGAKLSPDPAWAFRRKLGERIDSSTDRRADCFLIRQSGEPFMLFGVFQQASLEPSRCRALG
jgi:hypothetical protein